MGKENLVPGNGRDLCDGPITRSRACALRASGQNLPPLQQDGRRTNTKRTALGEKKATAPKKRAVLREVTNVSCENVYTSCFAAKFKAKSSKPVKKAQSIKVVPLLEAGPEAKSSKEIAKAEPIPGHVLTALGNEIIPREPEEEDHCVKGESSAAPQPSQSPPNKVAEGSFLEGSIASDDRKYIEIDDIKSLQFCGLYAPDIYQNLLAAELSRRPYPNFIETVQRDITKSMRGILVDWLVEVSEEYKLVPDTLYLTVYLIDWFLYKNYIERQRLQLLGITCMLIASKYEEICAPRIEDFCFITDNTYTRHEVLKMECEVLKYFNFQIHSPTSKTFLRRFLRAAQASYTSPSLKLEYLANYLAELTLIDYDFLEFRPSVVAASAVFLAKWTLDRSSHPWNLTLEHYTSYKPSDLKPSVLALQDLQLNRGGCPLSAIRMKYRQEKFKSVAALSSQKLLDTLF